MNADICICIFQPKFVQHFVQFVQQSVIADSTLAGRDVKMTSCSGCPFSPMPLEASIVGHIAVVCKVLCNCDGVCVRVPAGNMRGRDGGGWPCLGISPCSIIPMETSGWSMPPQPNLISHFVFLLFCFSIYLELPIHNSSCSYCSVIKKLATLKTMQVQSSAHRPTE